MDHESERDRVGVGWHGGYGFTCDACHRDDFQGFENAGITGLTFDGGEHEQSECERRDAVRRKLRDHATDPAEAVGESPRN